MSDKTVLSIDVSNDERHRIEELAKARGYQDVGEYLRALAEADAEAFDQGYFWTKEWQREELEADEDIAAGRVKSFDTMGDLITDLMNDE